MNSLEDRLKLARQYAGLTQRKLSELLGISLRSITNHEKNAINVSVYLAQNIAQTCKVDEIWLLTGQGTIEGQEDSDVSNDDVEIIEKHQKLVKRFKNPKIGLSLNKQLIDIEETDNYIFKNAVQSIKNFWEAAMAIKRARSGNYPSPNMENLDRELDPEKYEKELNEAKTKRREGGMKNRRTGTRKE